METPSDSSQNDTTYFIDPESATEMARLTHQDRLMTKNMGGIFPERFDASGLHDVLDVACGPGGWVLDVAFDCPQASVVGVDISNLMIGYAAHLAKSQDARNASFRSMDVLKGLAFPDDSFDFVNARLLLSFMPRDLWPAFIQECRRVLRPGGTIRLTEANDFGMTSSQASEQLNAIAIQALYTAGMGFSTRRSAALTPMLRRFLLDAGFVHLEQQSYVVDFSAGTEAHEGWYQNFMISFQLLQPFFVKTGAATQEEIDDLYQRALIELLQDDLCAQWFYLSAWAEKPRI